MICETVKIGDTIGIICSRRQPRRRCSAKTHGIQCRRWADKLCDYPIGHDGKTCDKPLCSHHAVRAGEDRDHCPHHPKAVQASLALPARSP